MGGQRIIDVAGKEWFEPLHPANVSIKSSTGLEPNIGGGVVGIDGISPAGVNALYTGSFGLLFDGNNWVRTRSIPGTLAIQATPYSGLVTVAITTIATTSVKSASGALGTITNAGNAITGIVTVYDSLSATGKKIWAGTLAAGQVLPLGIPCGIGITITTAAADTLAVSYA